MAKYTITFHQKRVYNLEISAKNEEEAEEKLFELLEKMTDKQFEKCCIDHEDFEIDEIE